MIGKMVKRALLGLALIAALACVVVGVRGYQMYRSALQDKGIDEAVAQLRAQPGYTPADELPQVYLDAVVAIEDHRFYTHCGIDIISICRAAWNDLRTMSLEEGGSTITQQVAKNLFLSQKKEFTRKVAEIFLAFDLETTYTKREILEFYVNSSYFGLGCTGIGQAAPAMLGVAPANMTLDQAALMAGIPNEPGLYSSDRQAAEARRDVVFMQMEKYGLMPKAALRTLAARGVSLSLKSEGKRVDSGFLPTTPCACLLPGHSVARFFAIAIGWDVRVTSQAPCVV